MLNILFPMVNVLNDKFFNKDEYLYPKPLIEIDNCLLIEKTINYYKKVEGEKKFIFIIDESLKQKHHLDNILKQITSNNCKIITVASPTRGALCTSLLAIEHMKSDEELIICNYDQVIFNNPNTILTTCRQSDSCILTFSSLHPRWSYTTTDRNGYITRVAEKNQISSNAIAGFYYFKNSKSFINAAFQTIKKDDSLEGVFFISHCLNQLVLDNYSVSTIHLSEGNYIPLYTPSKIEEFKRSISKL